MNRRAAVAAILALPLGVRAPRAASRPTQPDERWTPLFDGRDLTNWDTWLGTPHGLNRDPAGVFSTVRVDDAAAIRISGEIYGALTTREEYENYHLRFEVKWGERRWPPREQKVRDSGCCYHCVGPHGASYGFWMQSFEFQVQEGDCGDFYSLAGVIVDAEASRTDPDDPQSEPIYRKGAPKIVGHTRRIIKSVTNERPHGAWNVMELYCLGQTSVHVVNGTPNMGLTGLRRTVDGREVPLTKGRLQFQSEGAEVFYRNIAIRRIGEIPRSVVG